MDTLGPMHSAADQSFLGIEGGGTRTVALASDSFAPDAHPLWRGVFGPGNVRLLSDSGLVDLFTQIAATVSAPRAIGVGMAGARDSVDRKRISDAMDRIWPGVPRVITHDLKIAIEAAPDAHTISKVLVLSGTGSCCYGLKNSKKEVKFGGWGHLLGDVCSGYDLALRGLRLAIRRYDGQKQVSPLLAKILQTLLLNSPEELISWAQSASKSEIAALAPVLFDAARIPDLDTGRLLRSAAQMLAEDAVFCAKRLGGTTAFFLAGGVFRHQPKFAGEVRAAIRRQVRGAPVQVLEREAVWGAIKLASESATFAAGGALEPASNIFVPPFVPGESPTEQRNPRTHKLSELSASGIVDLMLREEEAVLPALKAVRDDIAHAAEFAARALKSGGRIIYAGAGTSGRLGVLDASECPPTFRASPEMVQGITAGGQRALWQAVEGAEDDAEAGARAVKTRRVTRHDLVVGIASSGRTPFVWGALAEARDSGAKTVLITFNPRLRIPPAHLPDVLIAADAGPEVLTGSTRLKAGTATKLILNMISTAAMVRIGKAISNLMIDLNPSNLKLRDRAARILEELTGADHAACTRALEENGWLVKNAWKALQERKSARKAAPRRRIR